MERISVRPVTLATTPLKNPARWKTSGRGSSIWTSCTSTCRCSIRRFSSVPLPDVPGGTGGEPELQPLAHRYLEKGARAIALGCCAAVAVDGKSDRRSALCQGERCVRHFYARFGRGQAHQRRAFLCHL